MILKYTLFIFLVLSVSMTLKAQPDTPDELEESLKQSITERAEAFQEFVAILADKDQSRSVKDNAYSAAIELFEDKNTIIEVSTKRKDEIIINEIAISDYLRKLTILPYDSVAFEFEPYYMESFQERTERLYESTVLLNQHFRGYQAGDMQYSDFTIKRVYVEALKSVGAKPEDQYWEILFTKITVVETY
ncbi:MAG: hypothetical protein AAF806_04570 [Bacteroidota bacterium]